MSFEQKYRLLEAVPELPLASDRELIARETASGRPVTVHLLAGGASTENVAIARRAGTLAPEHAAYILDSGQMQGCPYVVTQFLPNSLPLRKWMDSVAPAQHEPGEFTRFFKVPEEVVSSHPPATVPAPKAPPSDFEVTREIEQSTPPVTSSAPEAGEFTRLFLAPSQPDATPPPETKPPSSQGPGEFTRMFQTPAEPGPSPQREEKPATSQQAAKGRRWDPENKPITPVRPDPVPEAASEEKDAAPAAEASPGEFTRMFQTPAPKSPPTAVAGANEPGEFTRTFQSPADAPPATGASAASREAGEFTRMLDPFAAERSPVSRSAPSPMPPSAPRAPASGEFTRMFGGVTAPGAESPLPGPAPAAGGAEATRIFHPATPAPAQAPPAAQGPSEFTRTFGTPPAAGPAPATPAAKPAPAPAPAKRSRSFFVLVVVLVLLFLAAVGLVLFFALRG